LLAYGETPSYGSEPANATKQEKDPSEKESAKESRSEAALFAYMPGEAEDRALPEQPTSKRGKVVFVSAFALACVVLMAVPRTRQTLRMFYRNTVHAAANWLNPPPASLPQPVAQHDSFGQEGDEYKLPTPGNIPDATTDASQIRVLPVIDPTAKPDKNPEGNGGQSQATTADSNAGDHSQTDQNQTGQIPAEQVPTEPPQAGKDKDKDQPKDSSATSAGVVPGTTSGVLPGPAPAAESAPPNVSIVQTVPPQPRLVTSTMPSIAPPRPVSAGSTGIPSSLKSQMASSTPDASGDKPAEAAMSSIEPVKLTESAAREMLAQPVDPEYPAAAKATAQRGSVVLQIVIGRDGAVQDVKFLQGSLIFARVAIDAVRQWRFRPYSMNGRAVSVQSLITLNFKPPT
jgi:protein TonB